MSWNEFYQELIKLEPSIVENNEHLEEAKEYFNSTLLIEKDDKNLIINKYETLLSMMRQENFEWSQFPWYIKPFKVSEEISQDQVDTEVKKSPAKPWEEDSNK